MGPFSSGIVFSVRLELVSISLLHTHTIKSSLGAPVPDQSHRYTGQELHQTSVGGNKSDLSDLVAGVRLVRVFLNPGIFNTQQTLQNT